MLLSELRLLTTHPVHHRRARLRGWLDRDVVDVDVDRAGHGEGDDVRDVLSGEGVDAAVDAGGALRVAAEANQRKLGLDEAGGNLRHPDSLGVELDPQR